MDNNEVKLSNLKVGDKCKVVSLLCVGLTRRRMLDLGLIPGSYVEVIRKSPLGDPIAYNIRGATIALRKEESSQILVNLI
ncbi:FeoA family protein [Anaeromicrobium sediminis]|uniref:Ferrous iron transport protein A n=1 Tax=Anaeromicrobium sediminis TaxID=1478221 RepID=A0A267MGD1_9FIRM|nr:FeoA family protein [Anaeromicrobium sediminis]PAB58644.1 ferrous iron transport protein A [Anaeromicrobium sediminis]